MWAEHIELGTRLSEFVKRQAEVDGARAFLVVVCQVNFVELVQHEELNIRQIRALKHPLLGEKVDVNLVNLSRLSGMRNEVEVLKSSDQSATGFVDQRDGRNDYHHLLESSLRQYRVDDKALAYAGRGAKHDVAALHDQAEHMSLEVMKHHALLDTLNPVSLVGQAIRQRHSAEVRGDIGEEADRSYHVEQQRLFDWIERAEFVERSNYEIASFPR
ncbi:hypothetical protein D3C77_96600 [compost metagenome]